MGRFDAADRPMKWYRVFWVGMPAFFVLALVAGLLHQRVLGFVLLALAVLSGALAFIPAVIAGRRSDAEVHRIVEESQAAMRHRHDGQ